MCREVTHFRLHILNVQAYAFVCGAQWQVFLFSVSPRFITMIWCQLLEKTAYPCLKPLILTPNQSNFNQSNQLHFLLTYVHLFISISFWHLNLNFIRFTFIAMHKKENIFSFKSRRNHCNLVLPDHFGATITVLFTGVGRLINSSNYINKYRSVDINPKVYLLFQVLDNQYPEEALCDFMRQMPGFWQQPGLKLIIVIPTSLTSN